MSDPGAARASPVAAQTPHPDPALRDVLVLTTRKAFWASPEARIFPNVLHTWTPVGRSSAVWNAGVLFARALAHIRRTRPRLVLVGSAPRVNPWLARLRRRGRLGARLAAVGHLEFGYDLADQFDRIVVHARTEAELRTRESDSPPGRYVFLPLPASGTTDRQPSPQAETFVFSGGRAKRDFRTLVQAAEGLPARVRIVTRDRGCVDWPDPLPDNVEVQAFKPLDAFLQDVRDARFVVVPLFAGARYSHGQRVVVQAMRLGRAVVATRGASVDDYVAHEKTGLLVDPGDAQGLRAAMGRLLAHPEEARRMGGAGRARALAEHTDARFAQRLRALCLELVRAHGASG